MSDIRYTITLGKQAEKDLEEVASSLSISKAETFRRALTLLKHAAQADEVVLKKEDKEQLVLVK